MKVTSFEKKLIVFILTTITIFVLSIKVTISAVEEAGGVKTILIQTGKDIKDIVREIEAH